MNNVTNVNNGSIEAATPETNAPEMNAPEMNAPEMNAPEMNAPEMNTTPLTTTENQPKITKTTKFSLRSRPTIIDQGNHKARFGVVECETGTDEQGKTVNRIRAEVVIEHNGNTERIDTYYNIQERGRGIKAFQKDYESWKSEPMSEEMFYDFDGETMSGKELCVEIGHRKLNNVIKPYVKAFLPAQQ